MQCKIPSEKFYGEFTFFYESLVVAAGGFFYNRRCQLMRKKTKTKSEEKQMKKLISLVLAGIMTFSLAACGQNATDNQTTAQNAQTTQSNEAQAAAAADSTQSTAEPMELTMYFPVSVGGGPDALIDAPVCTIS